MKYYKLEITCDDDGNNLSIKGEASGFRGFEILGFLDWKREDIIAQIRGAVKPDIVERTVVTEATNDKD